MRYLYDRAAGRRLKTVELVVEAVPWKPGARRARRRDEDIVAVRIAWHETDLRERAKQLGAIWRPVQNVPFRRSGRCAGRTRAGWGSPAGPRTAESMPRKRICR